MKRIHLSISLLFILATSSYGQVDILWSDIFPGIYYGIAVDSNNDIIVGGTVDYTGIEVKKFNNNGDVLWSKSYSGAYDIGNIVTDENNNIYVSVSSDPEFNIRILKLSQDGIVQWMSDSYTSSYSWATDITIAPNGDIIAIGSDNADDGWAAMRVDQDGNIIWQNSYNPISSDNMIAKSIICDNEENIIIVGVSGDYFATIKCDNLGNIIWHNEINYTTIYGSIGATGVVCDNDNNIYIVGSSSLDDNMRFVKYDTDGDIIFQYSGVQNYACFDLVLYNDTTIITGGGKGDVGTGLLTDIMIAAFNDGGDTLFNYINDINYTDAIYRMAVDNEGYLVTVGQSSNQNQDDVLIMKFDIDLITKVEEFSSYNAELSCYPNPSNDKCIISFFVDKKTRLNISVYNNMGHLVKTLINNEDLIGNIELYWNTTNIANGTYYLKLEMGEATRTEKIIVTH